MQVIECDELGTIGVLDGGRLRGIDPPTANANPASLFPRFFVTAQVWNDWVKESGKVDNIDVYVASIVSATNDVKDSVDAVATTVAHTTGSLSVSGVLNVT